MRADSELSPWPRMQEETTRDITGQHTPYRSAGQRYGSAAVQGDTRSSLGRTRYRRRRLTCRCCACGVMPTAPAGTLDAARRAVADLLGEELQAPEPRPRTSQDSANDCGATCPRPLWTRCSSKRVTGSPPRVRARCACLRSHRRG